MASPVCPKCGTALRDEYGMQQCPGCGAFLFVDMDGVATAPQETASAGPEIVVDENASSGSGGFGDPAGFSSPVDPQYAEHPVAEPGGAAALPEFSDPIEGLIDAPALDHQSDASSTDNGGFGFDPFANLDSAPGDSMADPSAGSSADSNDFAPIEMGFGSTDTPSDASTESFVDDSAGQPPAAAKSPAQKPAAKQRPAQALGPAGDPLGLNEFANSEISAAKDGPLLFRVLISGIDAKEIRESIREVIEDERFRWDPNAIISKITKGELVIDDLSPVKASILITRIKKLPVTIRWEQYAISQGSSNGSPS